MSIYKHDITTLRLRMLQELDHKVIDMLLDGVSIFSKTEHEKLSKETERMLNNGFTDRSDKELEQLFIDDEHYFLGEVGRLSEELAILALYRRIEITSKKAITIAYPDIPARPLHKIKILKSSLSGKGIDVTKISGYTAMDELRCLNNDIKHNGSVGSELAKHPGWTFNNTLSNLGEAYLRLTPGCKSYIEELINSLIAAREKNA